MFETVISKSVKLAEAPSIGEPILTYAPASKAATEYRALAEEIIKSWDLLDEMQALTEAMNNNKALVGR